MPAAAGAICVGITATVAPVTLTLALCAGTVLLLILVGLRQVSPRTPDRQRRREDASEPRAASSPEPVELRIARGLFYTGTLALGEAAFRVPPGLTISEIAFIFAFALCMLAVLRGSPVPSVPIPILIAVGIFVFGAAISSLGAQSPPRSAVQVVHAIYVLLLWPWVGLMTIRTRRQLMTGFGLWAVSAAVDGVGALSQVAHVPLPGTGALEGGGRYVGFTLHANDLGGVAAVALVPALIYATPGGQGPRLWIRWLPVPFVVAGLLLSGSVSGMAGAVLALLIWLSSPAMRSASRVAVVAAAFCGVGVLAVAGTRVTSPVQRVTQVASPGTGSAHNRITAADAAWQRIKQDPFVGKGLDTPDTGALIISNGVTVPSQIHGLPVAAWYESGLLGLAGLLGFLGCLAGLGWQAVRRVRNPEQQVIVWGLLGAFGAFLVEVMTQPLALQGYDWIVGVLLIAWSSALAPDSETSTSAGMAVVGSVENRGARSARARPRKSSDIGAIIR